MSEFTFYGASDDLIEVEGSITDEFSEPNGTWHGLLRSPIDGELIVWLRYTKRGGAWAVGVSPAGVNDDGDEIPFPDWPITVRAPQEREPSYSAVLVVKAPEATSLLVLDEDGEWTDLDTERATT